MPLILVRNDITKMQVDAIVNAANRSLLGGGGVDGSIHAAAGPGLLAECRTLGGCETGSAKVTHAYNLPCKHVIHAVGPRWRDGRHGERELLVSCYSTALALAQELACETVAFPLISSGAYGYPREQALRIALDTIGAYLMEHEMTVYLVIFDRSSYQISSRLYADIAAYIDDHDTADYERVQSIRHRMLDAEEHGAADAMLWQKQPMTQKPSAAAFTSPEPSFRSEHREEKQQSAQWTERLPPPVTAAPCALPDSLADAMQQVDESFSEMLLRLIDERGMSDAACYKKANIDRKLFSKIRSDRNYQPSKPTVLAFAIALELSLSETQEMLMKAGFALSTANRFDIILRYFIERGEYNVFAINEALFAFDQNLLGG